MKVSLTVFGILLSSLTAFGEVAVDSRSGQMVEVRVTGLAAETLKKALGEQVLTADRAQDNGVIKSVDCTAKGMCRIEATGEILSKADSLDRAQAMGSKNLVNQLKQSGGRIVNIPMMGFDLEMSHNSKTLDGEIFDKLFQAKLKEIKKSRYTRDGAQTQSAKLQLSKDLVLECSSDRIESGTTRTCMIMGIAN